MVQAKSGSHTFQSARFSTIPPLATLTLHPLARPHPLFLAPPFPKSLLTVLTLWRGSEVKRENESARDSFCQLGVHTAEAESARTYMKGLKARSRQFKKRKGEGDYADNVDTDVTEFPRMTWVGNGRQGERRVSKASSCAVKSSDQPLPRLGPSAVPHSLQASPVGHADVSSPGQGSCPCQQGGLAHPNPPANPPPTPSLFCSPRSSYHSPTTPSKAKGKGKQTHNHANARLLGRDALVKRIVDDEVQKDVEPAQDASHLSASLDEDRDPLVHKLISDERTTE